MGLCRITCGRCSGLVDDWCSRLRWRAPDIAPTPLQFAAAGEVVVHELEYSENVQVFQVEGDEGAMILWVDEEAML